jgi:hypothetical protein
VSHLCRSVGTGTYAVDWYDITECVSRPGDDLTAPNEEPLAFAVPATINGPAVQYLKRMASFCTGARARTTVTRLAITR